MLKLQHLRIHYEIESCIPKRTHLSLLVPQILGASTTDVEMLQLMLQGRP